MKKIFSKNVKKIFIIGFALFTVTALLFLISNLKLNETGIFKTGLNKTNEYNTYEDKFTVGEVVSFTQSHWNESKALYCIEKGNWFPGKSTVAARYYINNTDVQRYDGYSRPNEQVRGKDDIKYHLAVLHAMAEAHGRGYHTIGETVNTDSEFENIEKGNNRYQKAIWAISYYYDRWDVTPAEYDDCYYDDDGNKHDYAYASTARRAIRFADFIYESASTPVSNRTNMSDLRYYENTKINGYTVVGPYKIQFPRVTDTNIGVDTAGIDFGKITAVNRGRNISTEDLYMCDINGRRIYADGISSNTEFYVAIKNGYRNEENTLTFEFDGYDISGVYYKFTSTASYQDFIDYERSEIDKINKSVTITIPSKNVTNTDIPITLELTLNKTDDNYNAITNNQATFAYSKSSGDYSVATTNENGQISITSDLINKNLYDSLNRFEKFRDSDERACKVYRFSIYEEKAPEGYKLFDNKITVDVYIYDHLVEGTQNTEGNQTNTTYYYIRGIRISTPNNKDIKYSYSNEDITKTNEGKYEKAITYDEQEPNIVTKDIGNISIPNKKIAKTNYGLTINKVDNYENELDGAEFSVSISGNDDTKVKIDPIIDQDDTQTNNNIEEQVSSEDAFQSDIYTFTLSKNNKTILHKINNGGFISYSDTSIDIDEGKESPIQSNKLIVSNINNIINISEDESGKMELNLNDIYYEGDIYIKIKENNPPNYSYEKIEDIIKIKITVHDGKIESIENISESQPSNITVNSSKENGTSNVTFINNLKEAKIGTGKIVIKKVDNADISKALQGVKFGIYENENLIKTENTTENGMINGFEFGYTAPIESNEGDLLSPQTYSIKEIQSIDGYVKLDETEKLIVTMGGLVGSDKVITGYSILKNETKNNIYCQIGDSNSIIEPNNTLLIYSKELYENNSNNNYIDAINNIQVDEKIPVLNSENGLDTSNIVTLLTNKQSSQGEFVFDLKKVDSNNYDMGLSNAEFTVYTEEEFLKGFSGESNVVATDTTNENGIASINIPLTQKGTVTYYIKETKAPDNYYQLANGISDYIKLDLTVDLRDNQDYTKYEYYVKDVKITNMLEQDIATGERKIKVTFNGNTEEIVPYIIDGVAQENNSKKIENINNMNITIIVPNDKKPEEGIYRFEIVKKSSSTKEELQGARFEIIDENDATNIRQIDLGNYTESGIINESSLNDGFKSYKYIEIEAPERYRKLEGYIEVKYDYFKNKTEYGVSITVNNYTDGTIIVNGKELGPVQYEDETDMIKHVQSTTVKNQVEITVENEKEQNIDLALKKFISGVSQTTQSVNSKYNESSNDYIATSGREPIYNTESLKTTTEATYTFDKTKPVEVANGDIVRYVIRIYNEGQSDGYASEIRDYLPNGVKLAENSTINDEYGWTSGQDSNNKQYIRTKYLENEMIGRYEGGITLNYKDVQVELEVTESDMYIGTLTNVAEIFEMKDQDGNLITQDIDSTVLDTIIDRSGETITDYNPKEDDIDFEWIKLKEPVLAGRIWLDVPPDNSKDDNNDIIDNHEIISGEETFRTIKENGGINVELYKNGELFKIIELNDDGTYEVSVPKSDDGKTYNSYEVRYSYNGMDYTNVLKNAGDDNTINSKAAESIGERTAFNNKFGTINGQSDIAYSSNQEKTISKYNISSNMIISSTTGTITLSKDTNAEDLKYYNLGLKRRSTFDLALIKDVTSAKVTVNGQTEEYKYDKLASYNPETQSFDEFTVKLRNGDFNSSLGIRDIDRNALNSVVATYSLRILNQSSTFGEATVVKDYYDNSIYDVSRVYIKDNNNIIDVTYRVENGVIIISVPGHVLGNNESYYVYVDLAVKSEKIAELKDINNKLEPLNYAEICEYKTYTDKTKTATPGIIDINSAPDNYVSGFNENDTGKAPVIYIGDRDESVRTLSGNVFEDAESRLNITGVKVQLIENTADGTWVVRDEVETIDGNYTFTGFLPGVYIVRFNYGNDKKTVLTTENGGLNATSYNGQDYANTDYNAENYTDAYWYLTVTDKSDAVDNEARRSDVNGYSKVLTNHIAEILNSWKANPIDEMKIQELIQKTGMYGDTAQMTISVEYGGPIVSSTEIKPYNVSGVDFGLIRRPISEIELAKNVSKLTLKSSSGETLVEAEPQRNGNSVQWMINSFVKVEQEDSVLNGANLEIEYTLTAKGIGQVPTKASMIVDYIDNNLRFEESVNPDWQVIQASELQNDDETKSLVNNNIDLSNRQTIVVTTDTNPLETKLANGETATAKIVLTKTITTSNSVDDNLSYNNIAEILITENDEGRITKDSIPGNLNPNDLPEKLEPGDASAELVSITNPTGQTRVYYVLGITIAVILAAGIVAIKKFVIDKRN